MSSVIYYQAELPRCSFTSIANPLLTDALQQLALLCDGLKSSGGLIPYPCADFGSR